MKLLELLVKERVGSNRIRPWTSFKQLGTGELLITHGAVTVKVEGLDGLPVADDWQTVIVTKEQYDNACKLVDGGYTLWFGGECPVNHDTVVDLAFDDNADIDSAQPAFHYDWKNQSAPNIIAYKVVKPVLISTHKHDAPLEAFRAGGWTDDLLIEHGFAKIAEPGEIELFRPGVSCSEIPSAALTHKHPRACDSTDVVNHPSHYTNGKVECIDAIESATVGKTGIEAVCVANVIKYLWRYEDKNGLEDIKKAQWYLNKLIEVKK